MENKSFTTERLILKPTTIDDGEFLFTLMNTPKWLKYIGDRNISSIEEAERYIETRILPQLKRLGFSNYTLIRKNDGVKLGSCGLYDREGVTGIDIGFAILPEYERMGYIREATERLKQAAFEEFSLKEIKAITTKDNFASQKILQIIGMQPSGTTKLPGDEEELLCYSLML